MTYDGRGDEPMAADPGSGMNDRLIEFLEYRVVLGALITTLDGLVVAHAGLTVDDAEMLAAASSAQPDDHPYSSATTRGGVLHVLRGEDIRLLVLTEPGAPESAVTDLMTARLVALEESIEV